MQNETRHTPLHKRAADLLLNHGDELQDIAMHEKLKFLNDLVNRKIVWGTALQVIRITKIEAQFNPDQSPSAAVAS